jgi:hypothetical protein
VLALPNLETKFVAANTLIGIEKPKQQLSLFDDSDIEALENQLKEIRHRLFSAKTPKIKRELRDKDKKLREQIGELLEKQHDIDNATAQQLAQWNPYDQNASSGFFDSEWMFGFNGFDIVIGNPPYIDIKQLNKSYVKKLFNLFSTAENRINLYSLFIEKSSDLSLNNGVIAFINPNSILLGSSYRKIRQKIVNDVYKIIKLPDSIFESAAVETILLFLQKNNKHNNILGKYFKNNDDFKTTIIDFDFFNKELWRNDVNISFNIFATPVLEKLINKIELNSSFLKQFVDFSLGITPYDKYKGHAEELIKTRAFHSTEKINENYVPLISGKNIIPYYISSEINEYLYYGDWLGAPREKRFFTSPRIIVRQIISGNPARIYAGYTENELYYTQIGFSILIKHNFSVSLKYILALLNSKLINFYHRFKFLDIEKNTFQKILIQNCKLIPIKELSPEQQQPFIELVDKILASKACTPPLETSALERDIDLLVYRLYDLTAEEINIIES